MRIQLLKACLSIVWVMVFRFMLHTGQRPTLYAKEQSSLQGAGIVAQLRSTAFQQEQESFEHKHNALDTAGLCLLWWPAAISAQRLTYIR